jgi:hypothetical protein
MLEYWPIVWHDATNFSLRNFAYCLFFGLFFVRFCCCFFFVIEQLFHFSQNFVRCPQTMTADWLRMFDSDREKTVVNGFYGI